MAETAFQVTYDGPALATGDMPVRDLAPALLALGNLFSQASKVIHPEREPVALNIRATTEGSFVVQLILHSAWEEILDIFGSKGAAALIALKEAVLAGGAGLFWFIRHLNGRSIVSQQPVPGSDNITVTLDDGTTVDVPANVLPLYLSIDIRRRARDVVQPLTRPGVEILRFQVDKHVTLELRTNDVPAYDPPTGPVTPLADNETEMILEIASVAFTEGNKWRLSDGDRIFAAAIEDHEFLARVEEGEEAFRKGDRLRANMRVIQIQEGDRLRTDYIVTKVTEHVPRPTQMRLDDPDTT
jgi:hypothetical protein